MNPYTAHRNPWAEHRHWQVFRTLPPTHPAVTPLCSHTTRRAATACAWARDALALITHRQAPHIPAHDIRRTPSLMWRTREANGELCAVDHRHYCALRGIWHDGHTADTP